MTTSDESAQHLAIMNAKARAFRWPKGQTGRTPSVKLYHEARAIARQASPEMMQRLIDLAKNSPDDRVASVCAMAVLDRAGVRPIDFDPAKEKPERPPFDPRDYSADELALIEQVLLLLMRPRATAAGEDGEHRQPHRMPFASDVPRRTGPR